MQEKGDCSTGRSADFERMIEAMRPLFWDTEPEKLDMTANSQYIISRLLSKGGMPGYIWVQKLYTEADIVEAIIKRRDMDPVMRNFMCERYRIPKEQLIQPAYRWR